MVLINRISSFYIYIFMRLVYQIELCVRLSALNSWHFLNIQG